MMDEAQYQQLLEESKAYLHTRYDLLRLSLLEKLSKILGLVLLAVVVTLLLFAALSFGAIAVVFVLAEWMPVWASALIIGALFLLLIVLAFAFRKQWFINPMVAALSAILFADEAANEATESPDNEIVTGKEGAL